MTDRMDFTTGKVAQRARRNPLMSTTHATQNSRHRGAEPAVLFFIMESVVRCLDDEGRATLRRACSICMATLDKEEREPPDLDSTIAMLNRALRRPERP